MRADFVHIDVHLTPTDAVQRWQIAGSRVRVVGEGPRDRGGTLATEGPTARGAASARAKRARARRTQEAFGILRTTTDAPPCVATFPATLRGAEQASRAPCIHRFKGVDGAARLLGHASRAFLAGMTGRVRKHTVVRKFPRQERAVATVEAILEASARLLARDGWSKATTNRIAAAAGVSVGSLYQYFPSKDAIAVELLRRYRERLTATVARKLAQTERVTFEGAVGTLLEALFDAEGIDARLHRVLIEQVLRTSSRGDLAGFEERLEALVVAALERAGAAASTPNKGLAATVVVRSVLSLVHAVVLDRPDLDRAEMAREATKLITRYLA